ncbi:MAG: fibronectin type III domain-containing protein [Emergencia sp.]
MKQKKYGARRLLGLLVTAALVISLIPASAFADTVVTELNITYDETACRIDTSKTEAQVSTAIKNNSSLAQDGTITNPGKFSASLVYWNTSQWQAAGTDQISSSRQYAFSFGVPLKDGYSWPEEIFTDGDMSRVKITINGEVYKPSSNMINYIPSSDRIVYIRYAPAEQRSNISSLKATMAKPTLYKSPSYEVTAAGEGYKVSVENWYSNPKIPELTGGTVMAPADKFREGTKYMVELKFTADEGYSFVNGISVGVSNSSGWRIESQDSNTVVVFVYMEYAKHEHSLGDWVSDSTGHWKVCSVCDEKVDTADHTAGSWIIDKEATDATEGSRHRECTVCHYVMETEVIPAGKTSIESMEVRLSATTFTYNGNYRRPTVTVENPDKTLTKDTDYTVAFKNNKYVGKATVTITGIGDYTGQIVKNFKINPTRVTVSKLTKPSSGKLKLTWKKHSTQTTGFQIQYSTSSTFKSAKTVTVSSKTATTKTISSLKKGRKYYVRIRAYKTVNGVRYYSSWSAKKSLKA